MDFSDALRAAKNGHYIARTGWNGKGMRLEFVPAQAATGNREAVLPYMALLTVTGDLVPWVASHTDLLAEDWVTV